MQMKNKTLIPIFAMLLILTSLEILSAQTNVEISDITINGNSINSNPVIMLKDSENLAIAVKFRAIETLEDTRVKIFISNKKDSVFASSDRFNVFEGMNYIQRLIINQPNKLKYKLQTYNLTVRISSKGEAPVEKNYLIEMSKIKSKSNSKI